MAASEAAAPVAGRFSRADFAAGVGLLLLTVTAYWPVHGFAFISFDDPDYVTANARVLNGLTGDGIRWAFTTFTAGNWHPMTWLSLMLDVSLFGVDARAMHAVNAVLHAVNVLLLFVFLRRATGDFGPAVAVAAVFAVHPMHVESVAWIAERKDVLSGLFLMLTLIAWEAYLRNPHWRRLAVVAAVYAGGLMAKPMLVTLPVLLLLLEIWPFRRHGLFRRERKAMLLLFAMALAAGLVTLVAQEAAGAVRSVQQFSLPVRLGHAVVAVAWYLQRLFWPGASAFFYPHPGAPSAGSLLISAAIIAVVLLAAYTPRRNQVRLFGVWWFLIALAPVLGIVQVGRQAYADRYAYLPFIGLYIAIFWTLLRSGVPRWLSYGLLLPTLLMFWLGTRTRLTFWRDSEQLYTHATLVTDDNDMAYTLLGGVYSGDGRTAEAIAAYHLAIEANPESVLARNNLATMWMEIGAMARAESELRALTAAAPDYANGHYNLGLLYNRQGQLAAALSETRRALELDPRHADAWYNLGLIQEDQEALTDALASYRQAVTCRPGFALAQYRLARLLYGRNDLAAAREVLEDLVSAHPDHVEALLLLGHVFSLQRDFAAALGAYTRALIPDSPHRAGIHQSLAAVYAELGQEEQARKQLLLSAELAGESPAE